MQITDEMVAAGVEHYSEGGCSGLDAYERQEVVRSILEAALTAALAVPVWGTAPETQATINTEMETAAKWHEHQAQAAMGALSCGSENWEYREAGKVCDMHLLAAKAIRALATEGKP